MLHRRGVYRSCWRRYVTHEECILELLETARDTRRGAYRSCWRGRGAAVWRRRAGSRVSPRVTSRRGRRVAGSSAAAGYTAGPCSRWRAVRCRPARRS